MRREKTKKRGIILLVVVSLLTLFILLGVTYAIVATQYKEAGQQAARHNVYRDQPATEFDLVLGQLLFDTVVRTSLQHQSLLGDLYGHDGVAAKVTAASDVTTPSNTGLMLLTLSTTGVTQPFGQSLSNTYDYYNGRVLTFLDGNAAKVSTRIVHYLPGATTQVIVESTGGVSATQLTTDQPTVLINGAPFNGTGMGFNSTTNNLDKPDNTFGQLIALMPHFAGYADPSVVATAMAAGADESWDAADYQNMALAFVPPSGSPILPSFHRPELVHFWRNNAGASSFWSTSNASYPNDYRAFRRQSIFRPMPWDHPRFTGSNSAFTVTASQWDKGADMQWGKAGVDDDGNGTVDDNPEAGWPNSDDFPITAVDSALIGNLVNGPWDIDNDGDGTPDSIWIDPGLPVLTAPNGRRYKRLVAILVKDMDGRVNVNSAGNLQQVANANYRTDANLPATNLAGRAPGMMGPPPVQLGRGMGFGPAEVDFVNILTLAGDASAQSTYQNVLNARYGDGGPGVGSTNDTLSQYKQRGMVNDHSAGYSGYSTPPDVWGRSAVALDYYGQPIWAYAGTANQTTDDPYEMEVDPLTSGNDTPYQIAELERLLRSADADAAFLPGRLLSTATSLSNSWRARECLTTASWSIPTPSTIVPFEMRGSNYVANKSVLDLYASKGIGGDATRWSWIVPFEIRHGEKLNINRPFGDGLDYSTMMSPGNSVIDEPGEASTDTNLDFLNDSPDSSSNPWASRQALARHLYCMMMMLMGNNGASNFNFTNVDGDSSLNVQAIKARLIAQWAINVVDFRDADSINTPFEYAVNPFGATAWGKPGDPNVIADGDPSTGISDRNLGGIVWGCERPELLITETLAWHDRRTEDGDDESPNAGEQKAKTDDMNNPDGDFDQRLRPKGAFFVELYNPWFDLTGNMDHKPQELYRGTGGVRLDATSVAGNSPVWRLAIARGGAMNKNPDYPAPETLAGNGTGTAELERTVYFTDVSGGAPGGAGSSATAYYPDTPNTNPIGPGRYAVIGSGGIEAGTAPNKTYTSYVGRLSGQDDTNLTLSTTRRIQLSTSGGSQFLIANNGNAFDPVLTDIQQIVAFPINKPRSLSVSEPVQGYSSPGSSVFQPNAMLATPVPDDTGAYEPPIDTPLDMSRNNPSEPALQQDGTANNFRTVHLQRLANPLWPWDAQTNPYITIDTSSVDLTVFNGVTSKTDPAVNSVAKNFQTFQRGGAFPEAGGYPLPNAADPIRNLWRQEQPHAAPTTSSPAEAGVGPHYFNRQLFHTLGYLNRQYHNYFKASDGVSPQYLGAPSNFHEPTGNPQAGAFPWLTFLNRPFANPMELLLVPCRSQYHLPIYYTPDKTGGVSPYTVGNSDQPFGHLLNFFQGTSGPSTNPPDGPQLHRLFDYVEVPSLYAKAEQFYNASKFNSSAAPGNNAATTFRPPFNYLSRHREPGRININTIADPAVFESAVKGMRLMDPSLDSQATYNAVVQSRQGYGSSNFATNSSMPSYFSNPFRSADSADLMPLATMQRKSIDATLLRSNPATGQPLFANMTTNDEAVNSARNPYFRYQALQKVGSVFTTQSNVYAVWMTMGYFEVEAGPVDAGHPDGLMLGQELGADTGEIERHRAFFIIDRSIPVAYQPGMRHNTDNAVLLRRIIE